MRDWMKRVSKAVVTGTLAMLMVIGLTAMPSFAAPKLEDVDYEGNGRVEVEFHSNVKYKNAKVKVTDAKGKKVSASIVHKDGDDLTFKIKKVKGGQTYQFTISGIRKKSEKKYSSVKGKIYVPDTSTVAVKKVEYDAYDDDDDDDDDDYEVNFEFNTKVQWKSAKVTITDGTKNYVKKIDDKDNDEIEVRVEPLEKGKTYQYTISGVRKKGAKKYTSISGSFTA